MIARFMRISKIFNYFSPIDKSINSIRCKTSRSLSHHFVEESCLSTPILAISLLKIIFSKRSEEDKDKVDMDIKRMFHENHIN